MSAKVKAVPEGYYTATPYLTVDSGSAAIDFYKKAFGAKEIYRMARPDGKVGHAEIQIGNSRLMLADEFPDMGGKSPKSLGGASAAIMLYVDNVDAIFKQAKAAGAEEIGELKDQPWGDRMGSLRDPFGHPWHLATHIEDVSPDEMDRRMKAVAMAGSPG